MFIYGFKVYKHTYKDASKGEHFDFQTYTKRKFDIVVQLRVAQRYYVLLFATARNCSKLTADFIFASK